MTVTQRPTSQLYTATRLTKGTASLDEIRTLLLHWHAGEAPLHFADRVLSEGILAKQTAQRVRDVVMLFRAWLLTPDDRAARSLRVLVEKDGPRETLNEVLFLYKARRESVLYDFTVERFWPACYEGELYLRTQDIEDFLREAQQAGRAAQGWAPETRQRLARGILRALFDVGLLREERHKLREYVLYRLSDLGVAYLAYDLHCVGLSDALLVEHPDWRLFGLERSAVLDRLDELDESAGLVLQRAGSVVRITWLHDTVEALIGTYTG